MLRLLRDGDTLKITRLDRLGRSVLHLVTLGAELRERGVGLHVIEQGIDTSTAEGRAMFGMLSVLSASSSSPTRATDSPPPAPADATGAGGRSSTPSRSPSPSRSTTPARNGPADRRPLRGAAHHRLRAPRPHQHRQASSRAARKQPSRRETLKRCLRAHASARGSSSVTLPLVTRTPHRTHFCSRVRPADHSTRPHEDAEHVAAIVRHEHGRLENIAAIHFARAVKIAVDHSHAR